jgi:PAS domain S-box-containing protein
VVHGVGVTHAIITTDRDGTIVGWDAGAEVLFGHRAARVVGRPVDVVVPVHLREAHWAGFQRAMRAPTVRDRVADLPVLCADGEVRTFAGRLLVLSDALGVALGAMAIYTDAGTTGVRPFG